MGDSTRYPASARQQSPESKNLKAHHRNSVNKSQRFHLSGNEGLLRLSSGNHISLKGACKRSCVIAWIYQPWYLLAFTVQRTAFSSTKLMQECLSVVMGTATQCTFSLFHNLQFSLIKFESCWQFRNNITSPSVDSYFEEIVSCDQLLDFSFSRGKHWTDQSVQSCREKWIRCIQPVRHVIYQPFPIDESRWASRFVVCQSSQWT